MQKLGQPVGGLRSRWKFWDGRLHLQPRPAAATTLVLRPRNELVLGTASRWVPSEFCVLQLSLHLELDKDLRSPSARAPRDAMLRFSIRNDVLSYC